MRNFLCIIILAITCSASILALSLDDILNYTPTMPTLTPMLEPLYEYDQHLCDIRMDARRCLHQL